MVRDTSGWIAQAVSCPSRDVGDSSQPREPNQDARAAGAFPHPNNRAKPYVTTHCPRSGNTQLRNWNLCDRTCVRFSTLDKDPVDCSPRNGPETTTCATFSRPRPRGHGGDSATKEIGHGTKLGDRVRESETHTRTRNNISTSYPDLGVTGRSRSTS